jgi:MFS transporter, FSR family, fosmidomycin resistance protein
LSSSPQRVPPLVKAGPLVALMAVAHFFHHLVTALVVPLLPFIRDGFGLTYTQAGLVVSAFSLAYGLGQPPAGWLADRIGPRILLTVGISGVALSGLLLGVAPGYAFAVGALIVMGVAGGGYHPAASPVIWAAVPQENRGRALGFHLAGGSSSHFLAPLLGVFLATLLGWRGAFVAISVPVLAFGLVLYVLIGRGAAGTAAGTRPRGSVAAATDGGAPVPVLEIVAMLVLSTTISATVTSVLAFVPLFIVDTYHVSGQLAAAYLSLVYFTGLITGPIAGSLSDRFGPLRLVVGVGILLPPALLLLVAVPFGVPLAAVLLAIGVLMFFRGPTSEAFFVASIPAHRRSTILGFYFFASMEAGGVLTPLVGRLVDARGFGAGFRTVAIAAGALALACAIVLLAASRAGARARTEDVAAGREQAARTGEAGQAAGAGGRP